MEIIILSSYEFHLKSEQIKKELVGRGYDNVLIFDDTPVVIDYLKHVNDSVLLIYDYELLSLGSRCFINKARAVIPSVQIIILTNNPLLINPLLYKYPVVNKKGSGLVEKLSYHVDQVNSILQNSCP